ncbi:MAG: PilZ domain-containing protein [Nitrospirota bacterium]|nr:PilZ domain-containing protein [Nitrospirota bacterium]
MPELRKYERHPADVLIKYRRNDSQSKWDYSLGITYNVSKSGACLFLVEEVKEGDRMTLLCNPVNSETSAIIKWVQKVQDGVYKAGMMFE